MAAGERHVLLISVPRHFQYSISSPRFCLALFLQRFLPPTVPTARTEINTRLSSSLTLLIISEIVNVDPVFNYAFVLVRIEATGSYCFVMSIFSSFHYFLKL